MIPERVVNGSEYLEPEMEGLVGENAATVVGFDLVRDRDGRFLVLEDNSRTPSGMAYAVAARQVTNELLGDAAEHAQSLDPVFDWLYEAMREAAPAGMNDPAMVLLTDGPVNSAWYEHVQVAGRLGIPLVQPGDIEVTGDGLLPGRRCHPSPSRRRPSPHGRRPHHRAGQGDHMGG